MALFRGSLKTEKDRTLTRNRLARHSTEQPPRPVDEQFQHQPSKHPGEHVEHLFDRVVEQRLLRESAVPRLDPHVDVGVRGAGLPQAGQDGAGGGVGAEGAVWVVG